VKSLGLSLSDQYWICPKDTGLRWENVNYFRNGFPEIMGDILLDRIRGDYADADLTSPDNTTNGNLRKRWIIQDGRRLLMKGSSGAFQQEPFNEVIASAICRRLGIPHADYTLTFDNGNPYSLCETFITPDTELIPARRVMLTGQPENAASSYDRLLERCETLGIPGVQAALGKMLFLDYVIANTDRHWNNFGFIRNAETLEWLGLAPVYDSGASLWHGIGFIGSPVKSKPFHKEHTEQIKLAGDLSWFDPAALDGLDEEIAGILSQSDIDEERRDTIANLVMNRAISLP
jgi:hypothetical protein